MKYLRAIMLGVLLLFRANSSAQIKPAARQIALANATVALSNDVFAIFNNPAGLSRIKSRRVGIYYSPAPFGLKQLSNAYAVYCEPFSFGNLAFGVKRYGYNLYNETSLSFSFSKRFSSNYFLGVDLILTNLNIRRYGSYKTFYLRLGYLFNVFNNLTFGIAVENIRNASYVKEYESIPQIVRAGLSYKILKSASLNFEVSKDLERNASVKGGIEYLLLDLIFIRVGMRTEPDTYTAGVGIKYSFIHLDYAVFTHPYLGLTHQASLIVSFNK